MPYPPGYKERTRTRILRSAERLFTQHGFVGTSIEAVMRGCGLTRGAFYAHFRSKADLYRAAMGEAGSPFTPADPRLAGRWFDDLLAPLETPAGGVRSLVGPWTFLVADAGNPTPEARAAYEAAVLRIVRSAARGKPGDPMAHEDCLLQVAALVGSLVIGCSVDSDAMRTALAAGCRKLLEGRTAARADCDLLWLPAAQPH